MRVTLISLCFIILTISSFSTWGAEKITPFKVAILMFDEVQIIDFAAPYEVFGQANLKYSPFQPPESQLRLQWA